jgi:hypothetical protein
VRGLPSREGRFASVGNQMREGLPEGLADCCARAGRAGEGKATKTKIKPK